ncbi:MAG: PKD domain-containing protein, partial [SAR202 cluster bacterium]|nr:PKD domain-containing protein [SAR202 cluster bacterium]
ASQEVELSGSFTLPESITDVRYIWDFGDGSPPEESELVNAFSAGNVNAEHIFPHFRWNPYEVRLTVSGKSEIGEITGEATTYIYVQETVGVSSPDLNIPSTIRSASRALQAVGVISVNILLWLAILSPVWIVGVVLFLFFRKRLPARIFLFSKPRKFWQGKQ